MASQVDPLDAVLDQAVAALRDAGTTGPEGALASRTAARIAAAVAERPDVPHDRTRIRRWSAWAVAASLLAALGTWAVLASHGESAFAQVVAAVRDAEGLTVDVSSVFGSGPVIETRMEFLGQKIRIEVLPGKFAAVAAAGGSVNLSKGALVIIVDNATGEVIELNVHSKQATRRTSEDLREFADPIEKLRHAKPADAVPLGTELIDGVVADVYRMTNADFLDMSGVPEVKVWVDPATHLPLKIVAADRNPQAESEVTFRNFDWNPPFDASRFSLEAPSGYTIVDDSARTSTAPTDDRNNATIASGATKLLTNERVPRAISWSGDSQSLIAVMTDPESTPDQQVQLNQLQRLSIDDGAMQWSIEVGGGNSLAASGDGTLLATAIGREIQVRSGEDGTVLERFVAKQPLPALALSGDGKRLVSGVADWHAQRSGRTPAGGVELWDVDAGAVIRTFDVEGPVTHVAISPDGEWIAAGSNLGAVQLWRADDGELVRTFASQPRATFSPGSRLLAVTALHKDGGQLRPQVELFDVLAGQTVRVLQLPDAAQNCLCLAFHPDGNELAAGTWEDQLCRWDVDDPSTPPRVEAVDAGVLAAAYSPDGQWLATGSENRVLQLWREADE
ncbi:MAG: hypothetical protein CMJ58_04785 [Planctomycetaceae bacterium]|nr:hypothetical protein [Planctomycetaceae bacterium]